MCCLPLNWNDDPHLSENHGKIAFVLKSILQSLTRNHGLIKYIYHLIIGNVIFGFVSYVIWHNLYIFKFLVDGKKVSSVRETVSSKSHKNKDINNHNNDSGASDFYENNLTIALCPKAELDDDCKYFYFMSDLHFHYISIL